ncbi:MAG: NTP transferase domain-containing protein [Planctomycetes bacterium]|nr:NTP transferase domain-containing protein [Planctomycetota bacterium]
MSQTEQWLDASSTIDEAARRVDESRCPVVVVDDEGRATGWISDSELRTAALRQMPTGASVDRLQRRDFPQVTDEAAAAARLAGGLEPAAVIVDAEGRPLRVLARGEVTQPIAIPRAAILMVGGEGTRLRPLTESLPKPLLPVGGVPILERILRHLVGSGISRVTMALGYRAQQIEAYFGDGSQFGARVDYVLEDKPLGTAGAIGLVRVAPDESVLVMNGDLLCELDLREMSRAHLLAEAALTVAARPDQRRVPFGVFRLLDDRVVSVEEKPVRTEWVNAGIYLLNGAVAARIDANSYLDMTVFMEDLIASGERVHAFPLREAWRDIGRPEDYDRANRELAE